jgi:hypothetical protein
MIKIQFFFSLIFNVSFFFIVQFAVFVIKNIYILGYYLHKYINDRQKEAKG